MREEGKKCVGGGCGDEGVLLRRRGREEVTVIVSGEAGDRREGGRERSVTERGRGREGRGRTPKVIVSWVVFDRREGGR